MFYQHRDGLLDEPAWQANLLGLKNALRFPYLRAAWPFVRGSAIGADFIAMVDKLIAETRPAAMHTTARYREALLREMQAAQSDVPPAD